MRMNSKSFDERRPSMRPTWKRQRQFKSDDALIDFKELMNSNIVWLVITTIVVICISFFSFATTISFYPNALPNNLETIAVILISYHEWSCIGAIESALSFAKYPQRVSFFIANADSTKQTKSCLNGYNDYRSGMEAPIIKENIKSITEIFSSYYGSNAVKAELIEKEIIAKDKSFDFVLETNGNTLFNNHWDTEAIAEWQSINNQKGILTTNPTSTRDMSKRSFTHNAGKTMNVICSVMLSFDNDDEDLQILYDHSWEIKPPVVTRRGYVPIEIPYWSAYFSFGPFNYLMEVKHDPQLTVMTFAEGTSFLYSMRLRSNGYKMYAPFRDVVFHNYAYDVRNKNLHSKKDIDGKEMKKNQDRMNMLLDVNGQHEHDNDEYGIGPEMSAAQFYKIVGIDLKNNSAEFLCERIRHQKWHS